MRLNTVLRNSLISIIGLVFVSTSFASEKPSLAQWISKNTNQYTETQPSQGTMAASINIPVDHYSIKLLDGNAMLISIDLSKQKNNTSITWQDGTQSFLGEEKFVPLLTFLEHNSLGQSIALTHSDSQENISANFGGIHQSNNNQLNMLIYNTSENLNKNDRENLLIQIK